jgi:xylulokinase
MEGVALACFDAYSVLADLGAKPEHIMLAGGGARSRLWKQIMADVFNLPVHPVAAGEQSALGAALLAGVGVGLFDPAGMAKAWASYEPPVDPIAGHHAIYRELLALFRGSYRKHRQDFRHLHTLDNNR